MAQATLSQASLVKAHELALKVWTFNTGRSKVDGRTFYVIPASDGMSAHWTTSYGCSCKGHRRHGICSHVEAIRLYEHRERVVKPRMSYESLFPLTDAF